MRDENFLMKRCFKAAIIYLPIKIPEHIDISTPEDEQEKVPWAERSERFDQIRSKVLEVVLHLNKQLGRPISYDEIISAFKVRYSRLYGEMSNSGETLSRRVRELRSSNYLVSPKEGYFQIGPRVVDREIQSST